MSRDAVDSGSDLEQYRQAIDEWTSLVIGLLNAIFPTELEANMFLDPPHKLSVVSAATDHEYQVKSKRLRMSDLLQGLGQIVTNRLPNYTDLPIQARLYIEDIDSFSKARDVKPSAVSEFFQRPATLIG